MKKYFFVANWKLNGSIRMIHHYFNIFRLSSLREHFKNNVIVIAAPAVYLNEVYKNIDNNNIFLGAQNIDLNVQGAFTGETSILMLKDIGVKYVIVGHSERRLWHYEKNDIISKKFHLVKKFNLTPILCIGETEKEKNNSQTKKVISEQLDCIFQSLGALAFRNTIIAYEPIWAIGTGSAATPEYVQFIHAFIKDYINQYDPLSAEKIVIQYGGSVTCKNARDFICQPDIHGLLVGSASLDAAAFLKIIESVDC